jgi:hypothetical protein
VATARAQRKVDLAHFIALQGTEDGLASDSKKDAQDALDFAAQAKVKHQTKKASRTLLLWAVASSIGIVAAAILKLYLLTTVGVAAPGRVLDVIATGLFIGAGTKPLHDLITLVASRKKTAS